MAAVITAISPLAGLIFIISFSGKFPNRLNLFLLIFVISVSGLLILRIIDLITFFDLIAGIAAGVYLYFRFLQRSGSYLRAILAAAAISCTYAVFRQLIWGSKLIETVYLVMQNTENLLQTALSENQEQLAFALELLETTQTILTRYYVGVWMVSIIFGLYLGSLLLSRQIQAKFQHQRIEFPFFFVYLLIAALVMFILPQSKLFGLNMLIILVPFFIIQGISILDFFWRDFFKKSRILVFILIFAMAFNILIMILVALIGLLDIWFDFRKIRVMEEIDENHFN